MKKLSEFKYPCLAGEYFPMIVFSETSGVILDEGKLLTLEEGEFVAPDINVGYQFNKEDLDIMRVVLDNTDYNFDIKINRLTPFRYVDLTGLNIRDYVSEPIAPVKFCELSREQHLDLINHVLDGGSLEYQCAVTGEWYPVDYLPDCEDGVYRKYDTTSEVEEIDAEIARLVLLKQELMK